MPTATTSCSGNIRELCKGGEVLEQEAQLQLVCKLTDGRLSHGAERGELYFVIRTGTLERVTPAGTGVRDDMLAAAPYIFAAVDRLHEQKMRASGDALEADKVLTRKVGGVPTCGCRSRSCKTNTSRSPGPPATETSL
jgi:hypothetical protein